MTKAKPPAPEPDEPTTSFAELAKALIATPQAQAIIAESKPKSFDYIVRKNGLMAQMVKPLMQEMLLAEMTEHLGYEKHDTAGYLTGNSRNGSYQRVLRGSDGTLTLDIPRDRAGDFTPTIVPANKQISKELEEHIISLYAVGTSTGDITEFLLERYGVNVTEGFISQATNSVLVLAKDWQARPLCSVY